jgi:hypothetical protein
MASFQPSPRWPRHNADLRRNNRLNYWIPGSGPNRLASRSVGFAAGPHTWHPDFTDFFPDDGRSFLPWPVATHARPDCNA